MALLHFSQEDGIIHVKERLHSDAMKRPKVYATEARKLLDAARAANETLGILEDPVVRYDRNGAPLRDLYGVSHQSDDDTENEEDDDEEAAAERLAAQAGEMSEKRKKQLEKEEAENARLHVEDAHYYDLATEVEAIGTLRNGVMQGDDGSAWGELLEVRNVDGSAGAADV
ncbi:hypothetical protein QFC24_005395 [Naganishia onofrii]|uniref:Uncharacterized protein n=1 Tax=Naganishia onofrii TaxID=1851511 RepID=A0ACC2XAU1_9TREE|nr:hypothetical protein QFC24_005395 [Naganishia onofrii]